MHLGELKLGDYFLDITTKKNEVNGATSKSKTCVPPRTPSGKKGKRGHNDLADSPCAGLSGPQRLSTQTQRVAKVQRDLTPERLHRLPVSTGKTCATVTRDETPLMPTQVAAVGGQMPAAPAGCGATWPQARDGLRRGSLLPTAWQLPRR